MDRHEEIKILTDVGIMKNDIRVIKKTITALPCKTGIGFRCWTMQTKAVAGTGLVSLIATIAAVIYELISKGGH